MILKYPFEKGLFDQPGVDTRYFGKDAEDFLKGIGWQEDIKYLGKECLAYNAKKEGVIIGIEDSELFDDYYFIVFVPESEKLYYELANNPEFINSIKL